jgi:hypothetical protein
MNSVETSGIVKLNILEMCAFSFLSFPFNLVSHSDAWPGTASRNKEEIRQTISTRNIMYTVFRDRKIVLLVEFLPQGSTIN